MVGDFHPADLAKVDVSESVAAPLFIEVETGLVVRHASIIAGCLPFETTNIVSVRFLLAEIREVPVETCNGGLDGFRVRFRKQRPLLLPFGEFVVLGVLTSWFLWVRTSVSRATIGFRERSY